MISGLGIVRADAPAPIPVREAKARPRLIICTVSPCSIQEDTRRKLFLRSATVAVFMIPYVYHRSAACQAPSNGKTSAGCGLGLVAGHRTPRSTPDAPPIPDLQAQPRRACDGESGVGRRLGSSVSSTCRTSSLLTGQRTNSRLERDPAAQTIR